MTRQIAESVGGSLMPELATTDTGTQQLLRRIHGRLGMWWYEP